MMSALIHGAPEYKSLMLHLMELGLEPEYKGFLYLTCLIIKYDFHALTKNTVAELSSIVASEFGCDLPTLEHDVLTMIKAAWNSDENAELKKLFSYVPEGYYPTFSEIVTTMIMLRGEMQNAALSDDDPSVRRKIERLQKLEHLMPIEEK